MAKWVNPFVRVDHEPETDFLTAYREEAYSGAGVMRFTMQTVINELHAFDDLRAQLAARRGQARTAVADDGQRCGDAAQSGRVIPCAPDPYYKNWLVTRVL